MRLLWQVEDSDVLKVKEFYNQNKDNGLVVWRRERNVERGFSRFSRDAFWKEMGHGRPVDMVVMGILNEDYRKLDDRLAGE